MQPIDTRTAAKTRAPEDAIVRKIVIITSTTSSAADDFTDKSPCGLDPETPTVAHRQYSTPSALLQDSRQPTHIVALTSVTTSENMAFRLLDLPAEMRVLIYEYTFGDNTPGEIELFQAIENHPETALLTTCRAVHKEAGPIHAAIAARYRNSKTFTVMLNPAHKTASELLQLMNRLGELTFPFLVKSLRINWLGSTASIHFKTTDNVFQHVTQSGKLEGLWGRLLSQGLHPDLIPAYAIAITRIDGGDLELSTFHVLNEIMSIALAGWTGEISPVLGEAMLKLPKWETVTDTLARHITLESEDEE